MKKSKLIITSLMLTFALFMVSCNDDDGISCPEPLVGELNATEIEFSGTWVLSAMVSEEAIDLTNDEENNPSTDIFAQYPVCDRDLVYDFADDRKYVLNQGFNAEDCTNKQSVAGTWALTANNALTIESNCSLQTTQITPNETNDAFSFVSTMIFNDASGLTKSTKVTFTYSKVTPSVPTSM